MTKSLTIKPEALYAFFKPFKYLVFAFILFFVGMFLSQFLNNKLVFQIAIGVTGVFLLIYVYNYLFIRSISYIINKEQIKFKRGIFTIKEDFIELYRVKDQAVKRPFIMRFINAMQLSLETSDKSHPTFNFIGIKKTNRPNGLTEMVEKIRKKEKVRKVE